MPGGDGTGPAGLGPMTGRAAGYCAGYPVPGYMNSIAGRGFGFGRGWGRGRGGGWGRGRGFGWGRGGSWVGAYPYAYGVQNYGPAYGNPYAPEPTAKEEMDILREQSEGLKQQLQDIQERITTIESAEKEK